MKTSFILTEIRYNIVGALFMVRENLVNAGHRFPRDRPRFAPLTAQRYSIVSSCRLQTVVQFKGRVSDNRNFLNYTAHN